MHPDSQNNFMNEYDEKKIFLLLLLRKYSCDEIIFHMKNVQKRKKSELNDEKSLREVGKFSHYEWTHLHLTEGNKLEISLNTDSSHVRK